MIRTITICSLVLMLFMLVACEEDDYYYGEHMVQNDIEFVAQVGHIYHTEKNSFQVIRVDDSRCPSGAYCILAGNATMHLSFLKNPPMDTSLNLWGSGGNPRLFVDSLFFQLKAVRPHPQAFSKPINQKDYRIDMNVSRHSGL
jgi:hypothetical protein